MLNALVETVESCSDDNVQQTMQELLQHPLWNPEELAKRVLKTF